MERALLIRIHELISQNLRRKVLLAQCRRMRPGFQAIFAMNRSSKALTPLMAWEMRTHFFDGGWVDEIGV
ncbi:hypothetical protein VI817_005448 [Penicillium citrinum]|nr:hypothetical protein VI817_005448 [Penicillium citrinum]